MYINFSEEETCKPTLEIWTGTRQSKIKQRQPRNEVKETGPQLIILNTNTTKRTKNLEHEQTHVRKNNLTRGTQSLQQRKIKRCFPVMQKVLIQEREDKTLEKKTKNNWNTAKRTRFPTMLRSGGEMRITANQLIILPFFSLPPSSRRPRPSAEGSQDYEANNSSNQRRWAAGWGGGWQGRGCELDAKIILRGQLCVIVVLVGSRGYLRREHLQPTHARTHARTPVYRGGGCCWSCFC